MTDLAEINDFGAHRFPDTKAPVINSRALLMTLNSLFIALVGHVSRKCSAGLQHYRCAVPSIVVSD